MPKYLFKAQLNPDAMQGLQKEGGTARKNYIEKLIQEAGGTVESFYYAFGETDTFVITEMPDTVAAASLSLAINSSGTVKVTVVPLITPAEADEAIKKRIKYRAPGK
ncbi:MAG: GYD domain-containing protein [Bacteroidota bacterium]|nr:GYD domain-containing protein [Bacteroidota bacterium]